MSLGKILVSGVVILSVFSALTAVAQENLNCVDIKWSSAVTDQYPNIADACVGVMERKGKKMAKVRVVVTAVRDNKVSFRFLHPDRSRSDVYQTELRPEWTSAINEKRIYSPTEGYGMTLSAYIHPDRWAIIQAEQSPDPADATDLYREEDTRDLEETTEMAEVMEQPAAEKEPGKMAEARPVPSMPATAGPLPLIGLTGAVFLALGGGIRLLRRRLR